jgi:hypothetical protein
MEKKILPYLVLLSALSVSLSAAFYSVSGIGKLFAGASVQAMIMMSSLEISKLVLASVLYQYWDKLNTFIKTYYFIAIFILMGLTSAGIYGYLSSAYSETSNKIENVAKRVNVLDLKRNLFETQLKDVRSEKESISQNISDLTKGLSSNYIEVRGRDGQITRTTSSGNRKVFESQLISAQKNRDEISKREISLTDSISSIDIQKLNLESNDEIAGEIGSLKYLAKITNKTTDQVINWIIIALMLVFDPLAVSLIVGANVIFKDKEKEGEKIKISQKIDQKIQDFKVREDEIKKIEEEILDKVHLIEERESKIKEEELKMINKEEELKIRENQYDKVKDEIESIEITKKNIIEEKESIEKEKEILKERESNLEKSKEELTNLDQEIKRWEATHWKMRRRTPPPSSI